MRILGAVKEGVRANGSSFGRACQGLSAAALVAALAAAALGASGDISPATAAGIVCWMTAVAIGTAALANRLSRQSRDVACQAGDGHEGWPERLLDATRQLAFVANLGGEVRRASDAFADFAGRAPEQLAATRLAELIHEDDRGELTSALARIAAASGTVSFLVRTRRSDGTFQPLEWNCPAVGPEEDFFFAAAQEAAAVGGNGPAEARPADDASGASIRADGDSWEELDDGLDSVRNAAQPETLQRHDEGQLARASAHCPNLDTSPGDQHPAPTSVTSSLRWQGRVRMLLEAHARTERALRSAYDGLWEWDVAADDAWYSPRFRELLGYEPDDQFPERFASFEARLHPADHEPVMAAIRGHLERDEQPFDVECRLRTKRGKWKWFRIRGKSFTAKDGGAVTLAGAMCDVTDLKGLTESLVDSRHRVRSLLDGLSEGVFGVDAEGNCTFCDSTCAELLGYHDPAEFLQRSMHDLIHSTKADQTPLSIEDCKLHRTLATGEECACQNEAFWRLDGTRIPVEYRSIPILKAGRVTGAVVAFRSAAERIDSQNELREQEEQRQHSQRLEAVGELAGGVAHEFNNLMQTISGYAHFAQQSLPADSPALEDLAHLLSASDRAATLTRQLLNFSRRDAICPVPVSVADVLAELAAMLRPCIPESITLRFDVSDEDATVFADPNLLQQVLMNLCVNARDAMDGVGAIQISASKATVEKQQLLPTGEVEPGEYVQLSVTDSGPGIPEELQSRIFEPFFTTKEAGKGTGMGLAMVFGVVRQHGGFVRVSSAAGEGATFQIHLPLHEAEASEPQPDVPEPAVAGGDELILVAEDNTIVRDVVVRILEGAGYRTLTAEDGEQAVELFSQHADEVDMLLFDVVMPNMSGQEAAATIRLIQPDIPVAFCTGYEASSDAIRNADLQSTFLVEKPFPKGNLLRTVRAALDLRHEQPISREHAFAGGER